MSGPLGSLDHLICLYDGTVASHLDGVLCPLRDVVHEVLGILPERVKRDPKRRTFSLLFAPNNSSKAGASGQGEIVALEG